MGPIDRGFTPPILHRNRRARIPSSAPPATVPARTKLAYGFGAVAYGIKDNGFSTFLLVFYNQVMGLPAATVGAAILIALVLDAFVDPIVGQLSDQTRGRFGRRHPWLYGSAIPIAVFWMLLWHPPEGSQAMHFVWLVVVAIVVRSAVSCYEVPSMAIAPELSGDYHERTRIMGYRYIFGWAGGLFMMTLAFVVLLPQGGSRETLVRGYQLYGWIGAALMIVAILLSAAATHRRIAALPPPEHVPIRVGAMLRAMAATLRNRAFATLMAAGLAIYTLQGISFALASYVYGFIWQLPPYGFVLLSLSLMLGVFIAYAVSGAASRRWGKPGGAARLVIGQLTLLSFPYFARTAGLFPGNDDPLMIPLLMGCIILSTSCSVGAMIIGASMMADVTEDSEMRTGRRSEGLFFAGAFFMQKCTSGVGIFATGLILSFAQFPSGAVPGAVPAQSLERLALTYAGAIVVLGLLCAWAYSRFPFGRDEHEARLRQLAVAAGDEVAPRG